MIKTVDYYVDTVTRGVNVIYQVVVHKSYAPSPLICLNRGINEFTVFTPDVSPVPEPATA